MPYPRWAASLLVLTLAVTAVPAAESTLRLDLGDGVGMDLVLVKPGTFLQGSKTTEAGRGDDERQRLVTIDQAFYLGRFPVTRGQFARFVRATDFRTEAERGESGGFGFDGKGLVQRKEFTWRNPGFVQTDDHPVTLVTFEDARTFCAWLAKKSGRRIDLPTEAQWEYACRAGSGSPFYEGRMEKDALEIAWFKVNAGNGTRPVGQKKANDFGLHDMSGNVYQWCRDWYGPYEPGPVMDPEEVRSNRSDQPRRVLRGGSWLKEARHCRSASRYRNAPASRNADNGFRVLAVAEAPAAAPPPAPAPAAVQQAIPKDPAPPIVKADADNLGAAPQDPTRWSWVILLCPGLVCAGLVVALVLVLIRQVRRSRFEETYGVVPTARRVSPTSVQPRMTTDGFWLDLPDAVLGSIVRYRCRVGNAMRTGQYTVAPGPQGQFVYTGGTPEDVEILDILPPETVTPYRPGLLSQPGPGPTLLTSPEPDDEPPPATDFPSAY